MKLKCKNQNNCITFIGKNKRKTNHYYELNPTIHQIERTVENIINFDKEIIISHITIKKQITNTAQKLLEN